MNPWLLTIPVAYLLGSIPFGYLLVRFFRKEDIRAIGSGNIGATNVARSGAKGLGIATLALDCLKGVAAVMFAKHIMPGNLDLAAMAAAGAIVGHIFPVWLGFRGGKGIATALGVFLALSWPTALCALGIFIGITLLTRYVSLGSIIAAATLPFFMLYFQPYHSLIYVAGTFFISILCILKHSPNIVRLKNGTENKLGSKTSSTSPNDEGSLA